MGRLARFPDRVVSVTAYSGQQGTGGRTEMHSSLSEGQSPRERTPHILHRVRPESCDLTHVGSSLPSQTPGLWLCCLLPWWDSWPWNTLRMDASGGGDSLENPSSMTRRKNACASIMLNLTPRLMSSASRLVARLSWRLAWCVLVLLLEFFSVPTMNFRAPRRLRGHLWL